MTTQPPTAPQTRRFLFWTWTRKEKPAKAQAAMQPVTTAPTAENFYERAIEWTHRADKVINLVLGYLLAGASVLGFMDVLSGGNVLSNVPYLFYVWLLIMGLGVDFQILLVIGRIPDLARMVTNSWFKTIFFVFNGAFLAFLAYMSVIIGAVFTQHYDVPGTIGQAMNALGIDSTHFVYERAALATFLLVLMAVDRTMERWRMHIQRDAQQAAQPHPQDEPESTAQPQASTLEPSDLEQLITAMMTMNQQNLQAMQQMTQHSLNVTIEQFTKVTIEAVRETVGQVVDALPGYAPAQITAPEAKSGQTVDQSSVRPEQQTTNADEKPIQAGQKKRSYGDEIEGLYLQNPAIDIPEIVAKVGCSRSTAASWLQRVKPAS